MKSPIVSVALLSLLAGSALLTPLAVHAAAPAMLIDKPGAYVLDHDIMAASGDVIMITASGVTLDLGGHNVGIATPGQGRGIVVNKARGVRIANGKVGSFGVNVLLDNSENVIVEGLQIIGANLAPVPSGSQNAGDPRGTGGANFSEVGVLMIDTRGSVVRNNVMTSVSAGIFTRGGGSTGDRLEANTISGGPTAANNGFGICFNPAPNEGTAAPSGNVIAGNHIAGYTISSIAINGQATGNVMKDNTLAISNVAFAHNNPTAPGPLPAGNLIVNDTVVQLPAP